MKDIDFDELDRAVSSLMNTVPTDDTAAVAAASDATPVVTLDTAPVADTSAMQPAAAMPITDPIAAPVLQDVPPLQSEQQLTQVQEPDATTTPAVAAPAVRRGRFMDVMPGSRDAKKVVPAGPISRQGVTLQPSGAPLAQESEAVETTPIVAEETASTLADSSVQETPLVSAENVSEAVAIDDLAMETAVDETAPLTSPFLPDAKVEKRPLGRPVEAMPTVDLAAELADTPAEPVAAADPLPSTMDTLSPNKDAQLPEQPLPAELGSELLTIETSAAGSAPEVQPVVTPSIEQPAPAVSDTAAEPATARAMAVTSIPQQYKVRQPSESQEAPAGALYDAQPVAEPAKKKSSGVLKIVIAFIVVALIGIGGGAAIYYLGLI